MRGEYPRRLAPAGVSAFGAGLGARCSTRHKSGDPLRRALRASTTEGGPAHAPGRAVETLAEHSPVRVSDLASRRCLAPSTASGLIDRLLATGLVTREVAPADRRPWPSPSPTPAAPGRESGLRFANIASAPRTTGSARQNGPQPGPP
ncbi:MarR family winged helix-turn-helix transcriptional regulator [Streptomyces sp. NPDC002523]